MNLFPAIISPLFRDPLLNADKGSGSRGEVNHEIVGCDHEFVVVVPDVRLIGQRVLAGGVADGQSGDRIFRLICDDPVDEPGARWIGCCRDCEVDAVDVKRVDYRRVPVARDGVIDDFGVAHADAQWAAPNW